MTRSEILLKAIKLTKEEYFKSYCSTENEEEKTFFLGGLKAIETIVNAYTSTLNNLQTKSNNIPSQELIEIIDKFKKHETK